MKNPPNSPAKASKEWVELEARGIILAGQVTALELQVGAGVESPACGAKLVDGDRDYWLAQRERGAVVLGQESLLDDSE